MVLLEILSWAGFMFLNFYTKLSALARGEKITKILDLLMYVIFSPDKCLLDLYCI